MKNLIKTNPLEAFKLSFICFLIFIFQLGCNESLPPIDPGYSQDILSKFSVMTKISNTALIDFSSPISLNNLQKGWFKKKKKFIITQGKESSLYFYSLSNQQDLSVTIRCNAVSPVNLQYLLLKIYTNEKFTTTLKISYKPDNYRIKITRSQLIKGNNQLKFRYQIPSQQNQDSIKIHFYSIKFQNHSRKDQFFIWRKDKSVRQYSPSRMTSIESFDQAVEMVVYYKIRGNIKAQVSIAGPQTSLLKNIPKDKKQIRIQIPYHDDEIVKIDFVTFSGTRGYIDWRKVLIYPKDQSRTSNPPEKAESDSPRQVKPDIILYVIDTLRADHLGCYGYERQTTPYMDSFAQENTQFLNAYANASWTRPSAATILTGLLPMNHKVINRKNSLPKSMLTLPKLLKDQGYQTIGFNSNGNIGRNFGFHHGFDSFFVFPENKDTPQIHVRSSEINKKIFQFLNTLPPREKRQPLFLWIWTTDPHAPYTPHPSASDKFNISRFPKFESSFNHWRDLWKKIKINNYKSPPYSSINYLKTLYDQEIFHNDQSFGKLIEHLKKCGIYEDAFILLTSDHGEEFFEHRGFGHAKTLYNELIKIPLIIRSKAFSKRTISTNTQHTDIFPTILDLVNIESPYSPDGLSLLEIIPPNRPIYAEENIDDIYHLRSILVNKDKLIHNLPDAGYLNLPLRSKLPFEMYNLSSDPRELTNKINFFDFPGCYLKQKLDFQYTMAPSPLYVKEEEAKIDKKTEEALRALGYIK